MQVQTVQNLLDAMGSKPQFKLQEVKQFQQGEESPKKQAKTPKSHAQALLEDGNFQSKGTETLKENKETLLGTSNTQPDDHPFSKLGCNSEDQDHLVNPDPTPIDIPGAKRGSFLLPQENENNDHVIYICPSKNILAFTSWHDPASSIDDLTSHIRDKSEYQSGLSKGFIDIPSMTSVGKISSFSMLRSIIFSEAESEYEGKPSRPITKPSHNILSMIRVNSDYSTSDNASLSSPPHSPQMELRDSTSDRKSVV